MDLFEYAALQEKSISDLVAEIADRMGSLELSEKVKELNNARKLLHGISPFRNEPIDFVEWVPVEGVAANDYNPNQVAPPEMELLRHSINHDGYTQPVVTWNSEDGRQVIDGFHRTRVCKELDDVNKRVMGFLPVVSIKDNCTGRNDRIASTIRHNRARGKHRVDSMSDIVIELKKRNWTDKRIAKELGMDEDEILRLCQVSGLSDLFGDSGFSESWDIGIFDETVDLPDEEVEEPEDDKRIFHTWDKWECLEFNFYGSAPPKGMKKEDCEEKYRELLSDIPQFKRALQAVVTEWKHSCEHYLTNEKMNRIAWLGQASLAYAHQIPACFRGGFNLLSEEEQDKANKVALEALNFWLKENGREELSPEEAESKTQANIY